MNFSHKTVLQKLRIFSCFGSTKDFQNSPIFLENLDSSLYLVVGRTVHLLGKIQCKMLKFCTEPFKKPFLSPMSVENPVETV